MRSDFYIEKNNFSVMLFITNLACEALKQIAYLQGIQPEKCKINACHLINILLIKNGGMYSKHTPPSLQI